METESILLIIIYLSVFLSFLWSFINTKKIFSIDPSKQNQSQIPITSEKSSLVISGKIELLIDIGKKISEGSQTYLKQQYKILIIFIIAFSIVVFFIVDIYGHPKKKFRIFASFSFIVGCVASTLCGYIGMRIAVASNFRTTFKAISSLEEAYSTALRGGTVMGFTSIGIGVFSLTSLLLIYRKIKDPSVKIGENNSYAILMESLAGFGLGGSAMALFGRIGGGIFTKAADIGADLVGKIEMGLAEDSPDNPATIADNVGDNVGDIAGMGSDLFGSFAEASCATLVLLANIQSLINDPVILFLPLLIFSAGIYASLITSIFSINFHKVDQGFKISKSLNFQLYLSTILTLIFSIGSIFILPTEWTQGHKHEEKQVNNYLVWICSSAGLVAGLLIGISTDYYTNYHYKPVRQLSISCSSGSALNIIQGLALGYFSTAIPVILISMTILLSVTLLNWLGVALAAVGMLSTLPIGLSIDCFGPIADNAGGISEMAGLGTIVRRRTDELDAAGNTTAAIGKGFAIGSASLVSLALYGAFLARNSNNSEMNLNDIKINNPWIISMFLFGAMIPYVFSAMTMNSVGIAASKIIEEILRQFKTRTKDQEPDYQSCVRICTKSSLTEMIAPGLLVILTPLFFGIFFHPLLVAGILPGVLVSGVQLAISMSNSGGAWDNCKKYIESGFFMNDKGEPKGKGSSEHTAAVVGDTVGDPLKDTSGPSLNILIKLMAVVSLVFAGGFTETSFFANFLKIKTN